VAILVLASPRSGRFAAVGVQDYLEETQSGTARPHRRPWHELGQCFAGRASYVNPLFAVQRFDRVPKGIRVELPQPRRQPVKGLFSRWRQGWGGDDPSPYWPHVVEVIDKLGYRRARSVIRGVLIRLMWGPAAWVQPCVLGVRVRSEEPYMTRDVIEASIGVPPVVVQCHGDDDRRAGRRGERLRRGLADRLVTTG